MSQSLHPKRVISKAKTKFNRYVGPQTQSTEQEPLDEVELVVVNHPEYNQTTDAEDKQTADNFCEWCEEGFEQQEDLESHLPCDQETRKVRGVDVEEREQKIRRYAKARNSFTARQVGEDVFDIDPESLPKGTLKREEEAIRYTLKRIEGLESTPSGENSQKIYKSANDSKDLVDRPIMEEPLRERNRKIREYLEDAEEAKSYKDMAQDIWDIEDYRNCHRALLSNRVHRISGVEKQTAEYGTRLFSL